MFGWCLSWSLEKKENWGRLLMCLYQNGIMALTTVDEGLGLLMERDSY